MENEPLELEQLLVGKSMRRRKMIPVWIKIFIWIFIVFACFTPPMIGMSLMGYRSWSGLYGLETNNTFSIIGLIICLLFLFKGIAAFALWSEKTYAIKLGIIDAVIGIMICCTVMCVSLLNREFPFNFRLELIALIPYLA